VGGWHAVFINKDQNAMTVNGTVHLNDYDDYENYVNNERWSKHERRHIEQVDESFGGSSTSFVIYSVVGYLMALSHDGSPLEIDADNHSGLPPKDEYEGGLWPIFKAIVDFLS
jgi:hypothetical protein